MAFLSTVFPFLKWARTYRMETFGGDLLAAVVVTVMLIPQSLAYALLAGLPPQAGLYASILPLLGYAVFGTSRALAVGPVALLSLMTAAAIGRIAEPGSTEYIQAAAILALLSGGMLIVLGALRLGFLANFLSHPVISGFITASVFIVALSQTKHLLGVEITGHTVPEIASSLFGGGAAVHGHTAMIGGLAVAALVAAKWGMASALTRLGLMPKVSTLIARLAPVILVVVSIALVSGLGLEERGVRVLGVIPQGLPPMGVPDFDADLWRALIGSAVLISMLGFVESVSIAQTLAARKRERIDPNKELIGLGTAGIAAGVSSGYPVTGGIARSAVNFDAGAQTPAAGAFTAVGIGLATVFLTPSLYFLPHAVLGATIIVAILPLIDLRAIGRTWLYSKTDFAAMMATILATLFIGVEVGIAVGVGLSLVLHLYNTSRPHFAIVGQVPGTEHFRNIDRHDVAVSEAVLTIRVDESLYFANARFLEDTVYDLIADKPGLRHLVLMCPAVNTIDASGLESLEAINQRLSDLGIDLHFSEIKGPVMDKLKNTDFLDVLTGRVFLHQFEAMCALDPASAPRTVEDYEEAMGLAPKA